MSNQKAQEDYLRETKQLMKEKLVTHGVTITDNTPFRAYVNGIDEAVANAATSEVVDSLRKKIRLILSIETPDALELTAEDFAGVDVVRRYAVYSHPSLTSVEIHPNVLTIDPNAFYGCAKLETVRLPKKVKLQQTCFGNCTALKRVYLPAVTDVSECPRLLSDKVFPPFADLPGCDFIIPDDTSYVFYSQAERWPDVLNGRGMINDYTGATET